MDELLAIIWQKLELRFTLGQWMVGFCGRGELLVYDPLVPFVCELVAMRIWKVDYRNETFDVFFPRLPL